MCAKESMTFFCAVYHDEMEMFETQSVIDEK